MSLSPSLEDLSSVPVTHIVEGNYQVLKLSTDSHISHMKVHVYIDTHTNNIMKVDFKTM